MADGSGVWSKHASQWERVGPPLRPCSEDGRLLLDGVGPGVHRVLVLGVTPEMARLPWPPGTSLLAVDRVVAMIDDVWPGFPGPGQGALLADWLDVDLPPGSRDRVVSDGCFGVLSWPGEHRALLRRVRRFLAPGGRFVFRVFVRPGPEAVEEVIERALDGRLATFHAFKLCLLMASQPDTAAGVVTGEVWERWSAAVPDPTAFAARTGWPVEQVATIDAYRGQPAVYTFPTLAEIRSVLDGEGFEVERVMEPGYPLGSRCPTLVARPR